MLRTCMRIYVCIYKYNVECMWDEWGVGKWNGMENMREWMACMHTVLCVCPSLLASSLSFYPFAAGFLMHFCWRFLILQIQIMEEKCKREEGGKTKDRIHSGGCLVTVFFFLYSRGERRRNGKKKKTRRLQNSNEWFSRIQYSNGESIAVNHHHPNIYETTHLSERARCRRVHG